jgi:hypothetical protein
LLEFQVDRRICESILLQKWPRNFFDVEDDAYKTPILAYNRELDILVSVSSITRSDVEKESSPPYSEDAMKDFKKEMINLEYTT